MHVQGPNAHKVFPGQERYIKYEGATSTMDDVVC